MFAYPCRVAKMETVPKLWSVIVEMDGQEDFVKFVSLKKLVVVCKMVLL